MQKIQATEWGYLADSVARMAQSQLKEAVSEQNICVASLGNWGGMGEYTLYFVGRHIQEIDFC